MQILLLMIITSFLIEVQSQRLAFVESFSKK